MVGGKTPNWWKRTSDKEAGSPETSSGFTVIITNNLGNSHALDDIFQT